MVRVGVSIRRAVVAEDVRHLQHGRSGRRFRRCGASLERPWRAHRVGSGGRRDGDGQRGWSQELQRAGGGAHLAGGEAQIAGGGAQAAMPEQQLDGAQVSAGLQQMDGERMTQGVRRDRLADCGPVARMSAGILHGSRRDRLSGPIAGEQPLLGSRFAPVIWLDGIFGGLGLQPPNAGLSTVPGSWTEVRRGSLLVPWTLLGLPDGHCPVDRPTGADSRAPAAPCV